MECQAILAETLGQDIHHTTGVSLIAESDLPFLVYISCAADTLARDIKQLGQSGFRIASTQLFDMFPRTPFFESVTVLER